MKIIKGSIKLISSIGVGLLKKKPDTPFRVESIFFLINFFFKAQELKTFVIYRVTHAKDENSETIVRILFIPFPCI